MKMKPIFCLFLCFVLIFSLLIVSCAESKDEKSRDESKTQSQSEEYDASSDETSDSESEAEPSEDPYRDENGTYVAKHLPEFKDEWKNYGEFRVLVYSDESQKTYFSEEIEPLYDTTDGAIVDGVTTRNNWIFNEYGITVKAVPVSDVRKAIELEISGTLDTFDVAMPFMPGAAVLAQDNALYDLKEYSDYIDLNAPWWDANATNAMSIGDKVYFTAGDMTIMQKIVSSGIAFNKRILADYFPNFDIYQTVKDGKWTLDLLYSMCKTVTKSIVDDGVMDENDQWGIMDTGPSFFYGCGETLISKDSNNYPVLALCSTDRSTSAAKKVLEMSVDRKTWMATVDDFTNRSGVYDTIVKVFGEDRSLFMALHFSAVKKLRPYEVDYGIVPAAKYDELQDNYATRCSAAFAYGICIPYSVKDPAFSAYMTELMCAGGKNYVSDTYYNVVLKNRDLVDDDSEKMLDLIFDTIVYDPAIVYGFSGLNSVFTDLIAKKSTDVVSHLEEIKDGVNSSIEDIIIAFEN